VASTVHASSGRAESAEALAQEAVDLIRRSDLLLLRWYAFMNLGRVLGFLGRIPDAASAADKATEAARLKGSVVAERRARRRRHGWGLDVPHRPVVPLPGRSCGW
jgi:hypothetical protein